MKTHYLYKITQWDNSEYWGGRLAIANIYSNALNTTQIDQNWTALKLRFGL